MTQVSVLDAARLAAASYDPSTITSPRVEQSCPHGDVQAHLLSNGFLLLPGSNSIRDYLKFNLRPLNLGNRRLTMRSLSTEQGASGTFWHQGFLSYSRVVFDWLATLNERPTLIIGHSLGAAAAQILSKSYGVPAVAFAPPRPKFHANRVKHWDQALLIRRTDDVVPDLPPGFSWFSPVFSLRAANPRLFRAHAMQHHVAALDSQAETSNIPARWPIKSG